jgi:hypothetical protein
MGNYRVASRVVLSSIELVKFIYSLYGYAGHFSYAH